MGDIIRKCSDQSISEAANLIKTGKLVVYPTDTLYGVGCNALDEDALKKIFEVKKRDPGKPLSIAVCDLKMLRKYASFDTRAMLVLERFLPGPVTFILRGRGLPRTLMGGGNKIGVRVPESRTALKLIMEAGVPIVSTSANLSGRDPPQTPEEALDQLPDVDLILDSGTISGPPSTVIDLTTDPPVILREGKKPSWKLIDIVQEVYGL
jgi:L-threonylcarbamoyladenylate synthase